MKNKYSKYSSLMNLQELFEDRYFVIPDYQRGYSWEKSQLEDLTQDIVNMFNKKHKHFTGTIVAARVKNGSDIYEIVDGQQRLTSLIILIKEIITHSTEEYSHLEKTFIKRGTERNPKNVLILNKETRECFEDVVIGNNDSFNAEIKSHECIINAKKYFKGWIVKNDDKINQITEVITNNLGFLLYTPDSDKETGIMFEVINNRGKALSELEKIKNYFIYYSTVNGLGKLRQTVNDKWISIQKYLSQAGKTNNDDENAFLRNCYLVFFDPNKTKSWSVYNQLKIRFDVNKKDQKSIDQHLNEMDRFVKFLSDSSMYYAYFFNEDFFKSHYQNVNQSYISESLKYLRSQPTNASILPLYLAIMQRQDKMNEVSGLLKILEIVNFRLYMLPGILNRADTKQGDLFILSHKFYHNRFRQENGEVEKAWYNQNVVIDGSVFNWVKIQLIELTKFYCNEEKFVEALTVDDDEDYDYYNWQGMRYFLGCYEEWLRKKEKHSWDIQQILAGRKTVKTNYNDHLSREHLWAKENRVEDFPSYYQQKRRLGNFVLLGLSKNTSLGFKDIPIKIEHISQHTKVNLFQIAELVDYCKESEDYLRSEIGWKNRTKYYWRDLSTRINDLRETNLIRFALDRWNFSDENFNSFKKVNSFENKKRNKKYILK